MPPQGGLPFGWGGFLSMGRSALSAIAGRWQAGPVLKQDVFSTIERGRFVTPAGEVDAVVRHLDDVPWWSRPLARFLMARERRALERASELGFTPTLLFAGNGLLVRGWIDGLPLQVAQPQGDVAYFRDAGPRCASCTAAASRTTISPNSRTGCAAATASRI